MLQQAARLLKPTGTLALSTPDWDAWPIKRHPMENYWPPFHVLFFNESSIRQLCHRLNLEITSIRRNPIPWSETCWPKWKRFLAMPYLVFRGQILREGGGRIVIETRKSLINSISG